MLRYNAGNRKDVREAEKYQKTWDQQKREWTAQLMSTTIGRRWMLELLEHCNVFSTCYADHSGRMAFMEGKREIGLQLLLNIMNACPDSYVLMMKERNERDGRRDSKDTDGADSGRGSDDYFDASGDDATDLYADGSRTGSGA